MPFFGKVYADVVVVSSNGYFTFGAEHYAFGNTWPIPSTHAPNGFVAPYWADLDPSAEGVVWTHSSAERLLIEWHSVPYWNQDCIDRASTGRNPCSREENPILRFEVPTLRPRCAHAVPTLCPRCDANHAPHAQHLAHQYTTTTPGERSSTPAATAFTARPRRCRSQSSPTAPWSFATWR